VEVKEIEVGADELTNLQIKTAESVIKIADKYGIERDYLIEKFSAMFVIMAELGTFKNYEFEED
jgi:hypothetical protein